MFLAKVSVVEASGLPQEWCKYVFCQYDFFNHKQVIVSPLRDSNGVAIVRRQKVIFENDHVDETGGLCAKQQQWFL